MMDRRDQIAKVVLEKVGSLKWIKLIGLGNVGVGKTCLIKYFCEGKFTSGYQPTVAVDYGFKIQSLLNEEYRVHLWDFSGNDDYTDTRCDLYDKTDGIFLVYDVTNSSSFDNLSHWIEEINKFCANKRVSLTLCACKVDQKAKRVVSSEKGEEWAKQHKAKYYEVSPSTGWKVDEMFEGLLEQIVNRRS